MDAPNLNSNSPALRDTNAQRLSFAVVVPSVGRPAVLHDTVLSILAQTSLPTEILLSVPAIEHVDPRTLSLPRVRYIEAPRGLCAQRNAGVRALQNPVDLVFFFDDDVELDTRYLEVISDTLAQNPSIVVANGELVGEGTPQRRFSRADAKALIAKLAADVPITRMRMIVPTRWLFGCHFVVRHSVFERVQFDERLPLYGYLEDTDFGRRCERIGHVCCVDGARMVHLAEPSGRISGLRFGYSQIMNPAYLAHKGVYSNNERARSWRRAIASNVIGFLAFDRVRRERFAGNLLASWHLLRGRLAPEHISRL